MKLLDTIHVKCGGNIKEIQLLEGDLTSIPLEHSVDVLVVSAFPGDYTPVAGTLIGALAMKNLSVGEYAQGKEADLRQSFSCWLSPSIGVKRKQFNFQRILCFEPSLRGRAPEVVGDIFRALAPFVFGDRPIRKVAMPIIAAGNQRYSVREILPPLLNAAVNWLSNGLQLDVLKIVAFGEYSAKIAAKVFVTEKSKYDNIEKKSETQKKKEYDVFISYSRKDKDAADFMSGRLAKENCSTFMDIQSLNNGASWQQEIFQALENSNRIVAVYSTDYVNSKVCQEEFNIAWALTRKRSENLIFPVYWRSASLPVYMELLNYIDCREGDASALHAATEELLQELNRVKDKV